MDKIPMWKNDLIMTITIIVIINKSGLYCRGLNWPFAHSINLINVCFIKEDAKHFDMHFMWISYINQLPQL